MSQILCRMRLKWYYLLKMSFHLIFEVFWLQKIFEVQKMRNNEEETE